MVRQKRCTELIKNTFLLNSNRGTFLQTNYGATNEFFVSTTTERKATQSQGGSKLTSLQGRNTDWLLASGLRALSSCSLKKRGSPRERVYSCFYKFEKHSAFNVWENLNKKLFLFAYISRVMNELLLLCIHSSLSLRVKIRRGKNRA